MSINKSMNKSVNDINGYKILYIHTSNQITSIHAYVKTGNINESRDKSGISHLLEHIIIDSWEKCEGKCTEYWSRKGIISNAQTLTLYTRYFIVGLSKETDDMINYIASTTTNPIINNKCIKRSKKAIKDELLIKLNNPNWKLYRNFYASLEDNTQYKGISNTADYELQIKNLDYINKQTLVDYHDKWYRPDNMFYIVVSNKSINDILTLFAKYLRKRSVFSFIPIEPKINCIKCTNVYHRKEAEKTSFIIGFINNNQLPTDYLYYSLIQDMLTGDTSSLLYRILRDKLQLVYGISLSFDMSNSYVLSIFEVSCQFENSKKLITNLFDTLKKFISGKFEEQLLKRSKERLTVMDMNVSKENTEFLSKFYANQYIMSNKYDITPDKWIYLINKINKKEIIKIIKRLFQFDKILITCETR